MEISDAASVEVSLVTFVLDVDLTKAFAGVVVVVATVDKLVLAADVFVVYVVVTIAGVVITTVDKLGLAAVVFL